MFSDDILGVFFFFLTTKLDLFMITTFDSMVLEGSWKQHIITITHLEQNEFSPFFSWIYLYFCCYYVTGVTIQTSRSEGYGQLILVVSKSNSLIWLDSSVQCPYYCTTLCVCASRLLDNDTQDFTL